MQFLHRFIDAAKRAVLIKVPTIISFKARNIPMQTPVILYNTGLEGI